MGANARAVLSRLSPLFWLASAGLAIACDVEGPALIAWAVITTGLGFSGTVIGAITDADRRDRADLIRELAEASRPRAGQGQTHLRRVQAR